MTTDKSHSNHTLSFLLAEDSNTDAEVVKAMLANAYGTSCTLLHVETFADISKALDCAAFEALILDLNLPDKSGIENVPYLVHRYPNLPIVVLTSEDDEKIALNAVKRGAQDYLTKQDVTSESLAKSLRYAKERKQIETVLKDALLLSEQQNKRLEQYAHYDFLTGLPNKPFFEQVGRRMIRRSTRTTDQLALLQVDINQFKHVNETYGREVGDFVLKEVATRLQSQIRNSDLITRLDSDDFIVLAELKQDKREIYRLIERVRKAVEEPYTLQDSNVISCTCSIGVAYYPDAYDLDTLLKQAEHALFEAKNTPSNPICFYTEQLGNSFNRRNIISSQIENAINNDEFKVFFQPVFNISNNAFLSAEALLRWRSKKLNEILPGEFIPMAEQNACIDQLTKIVLKQVKQFINLLDQNGVALQSVKVNTTFGQLNSEGFSDLFLSWLNEYEIQPSSICIELAEPHFASLTAICKRNITCLRKAGIKVALDNFGTGTASLKQLLDFPVDIVNIDKSIIKKISDNHEHYSMTHSIVDMAHNLGMQVVAGGIENKDVFELSQKLACDFQQGYFLSMPQEMNGLIKANVFH